MPASVRPLSVTLADVCFVHWPVTPGAVAAVVPNWLEPDIADGSAWVSALALSMDRFDVLGLPVREGIEGANIRTYVQTPDGDRGVFFLSVDLSHRLAAETARTLFHLPYHHADVRRRSEGDRTEVVTRRHGDSSVRLTLTVEPTGEPTTAAPDTLASFLVERDRFVTDGPLGTRLTGSVGHPPWQLQPADAVVSENTLLAAVGIDTVSGDPLAHFSPGVEMGIGALEPL